MALATHTAWPSAPSPLAPGRPFPVPSLEGIALSLPLRTLPFPPWSHQSVLALLFPVCSLLQRHPLGARAQFCFVPFGESGSAVPAT